MLQAPTVKFQLAKSGFCSKGITFTKAIEYRQVESLSTFKKLVTEYFNYYILYMLIAMPILDLFFVITKLGLNMRDVFAYITFS